jgi:hypothetical protein
VHPEGTKGTSATGVNDTLGNALMVEAVDLLTAHVVFQKLRTGVVLGGDLQPVIGVGLLDTEVGGDYVARRMVVDCVFLKVGGLLVGSDAVKAEFLESVVDCRHHLYGGGGEDGEVELRGRQGKKRLPPQWIIYKLELATDNGQVLEGAPHRNAERDLKPMAGKLMTARQEQSHLPTWLSRAREKRWCIFSTKPMEIVTSEMKPANGVEGIAPLQL